MKPRSSQQTRNEVADLVASCKNLATLWAEDPDHLEETAKQYVVSEGAAAYEQLLKERNWLVRKLGEHLQDDLARFLEIAVEKQFDKLRELE